MSAPSCEIDRCTIVLLGVFNPAIFQPMWLAKEGLVRNQEAEEATVDVVHKEVTQCEVGPFRYTVRQDRFTADADFDHFLALRDLVSGVFTILHHTPVTKMGLNRLMHFRVGSAEEWHRVGHALVPKDNGWSDVMEEPGTESVTVRGKRAGSPATYFRVTVEPSGRIQPGVHVGTNEHFDFEDATSPDPMLQALPAHWESVQHAARRTAETILNKCLSGNRS